jgi:hypothetical protein
MTVASDEDFISRLMALPDEALFLLDAVCDCEALCTCPWTQDEDEPREVSEPQGWDVYADPEWQDDESGRRYLAANKERPGDERDA